MTTSKIRSSHNNTLTAKITGGVFLGKLRSHINTLFQPVSDTKRGLLKNVWNKLPQELQTENQILGKHWVGCGYTMGPSYCSFGCSHCYLPKSSNRVPLPSLESMKAQILAQRELLGTGGNLQITGGDVIDAYWRENRSEDLIEVLRFASENELVPMLMTHGQILMQNPDYFADLVIRGKLRKLSIHIDITMAGRAGYPIKSLTTERQLNSLRDSFVDLVLQIRKRTGKKVVAAQTVTVTSRNIDSVGDILVWLMSDSKNMDVCRTISFQPEAQVGRTKEVTIRVTPERVWNAISQATEQKLARRHLLVGHPDCSSIATILVSGRSKKSVYLTSEIPTGQEFWNHLLTTFGGMGASSTKPIHAFLLKLIAISKNPAMIKITLRYIRELYRQGLIDKSFIGAAFLGRVKGFNIVMHNFLSDSELNEPRSEVVSQRLSACAFKGVVEVDGEWQAVSMCEMNTEIRPSLYQQLSTRSE